MIKSTSVKPIRPNWQMFHKGVSESLADEIVTMADKTEEAKTFGGHEARRSKVSWIKNPQVLNMLYEFVDIANRNAFKVNVFKKADIQYTEYCSTEKGFYDWHHDIDWNEYEGTDRKLSVTVQLSNPDEYSGGDFTFGEVVCPDQKLKDKGTVLVFPSYLRHQVEPVTKGIRKSLVAWFQGPYWQ